MADPVDSVRRAQGEVQKGNFDVRVHPYDGTQIGQLQAGFNEMDFGDLVAAARSALDPEALSAQERAMIAWGRTPREPVGVGFPPVLLAHGDQDVVIPPGNLERLAARYSGPSELRRNSPAERADLSTVRTEMFAGGGHAFMAQEPQRLVTLIAEFTAA